MGGYQRSWDKMGEYDENTKHDIIKHRVNRSINQQFEIL